ncbi:C2H2-type zinc finger protein [Halobacteria archaeon AArc-m2/3/4]|uniref:C2H2-type zinc finger protein n=1 Tax=Natronoglomus mannanivorans TaxID=2979990 RepID=A0AAP2YV53_9EURY|nr:C2H2-type zinc finger protein [Halobacteria archaeon AArc-xg1-1]MCU4973089.1 C2H2-type zinc finger protein [Halobacteria archaeon AArc-m2/3/4]
MPWECGIDGCGSVFDDVESAIVHQASKHERLECKVCGTVVPDGYLAIRHAFTEHSRAEYVRAYGASSEDVRQREDLIEEVESVADMSAVATELKQ